VVGQANLTGDTAGHAFLYNGTLNDLGTLGGSNSFALSINDSGDVVGYADTTGNAASDAFLYTSGTMYDLNALIPAGSGWNLSIAESISNTGYITGYGTYYGANHAFCSPPSRNPPACRRWRWDHLHSCDIGGGNKKGTVFSNDSGVGLQEAPSWNTGDSPNWKERRGCNMDAQDKGHAAA